MSNMPTHIEINRDEEGTQLDLSGTVGHLLDCLAYTAATCIVKGYAAGHDRAASAAAFSAAMLQYQSEMEEEGSDDGNE